MSLAKQTLRLIEHALSKLRSLRLDEIIGDGGARLHSKNKKWFYNNVELGTATEGTGGLWEEDGLGEWASLTNPIGVYLGDNELQVSNSGSLRVGNATDSMLMNHDGAGDHQILTTNNLKITPSGSLLISAGTATLNGNQILTESWSDDVDANANSILDLWEINFSSVGGTIYCNGVTMFMFDQTTGIAASSPITMYSGFVPDADLELATKGYVDSVAGGTSYLPLDGSGTMTGNIVTGGNAVQFGTNEYVWYSADTLNNQAGSSIKFWTNAVNRMTIGNTLTTLATDLSMDGNDISNVENITGGQLVMFGSTSTTISSASDISLTPTNDSIYAFGDIDLSGNDLINVTNIYAYGNYPANLTLGAKNTGGTNVNAIDIYYTRIDLLKPVYVWNADIRLINSGGAYSSFVASESQTGGITYTLPVADGAASGYVLSTNGSGTLSWVEQSGSGEVVDDTTPQLGGNLDVNGKTITATLNNDIELNVSGTGVIKLTRS